MKNQTATERVRGVSKTVLSRGFKTSGRHVPPFMAQAVARNATEVRGVVNPQLATSLLRPRTRSVAVKAVQLRDVRQESMEIEWPE